MELTQDHIDISGTFDDLNDLENQIHGIKRTLKKRYKEDNPSLGYTVGDDGNHYRKYNIDLKKSLPEFVETCNGIVTKINDLYTGRLESNY